MAAHVEMRVLTVILTWINSGQVYVAVVSSMSKFVSVGLKDTAVISILLHVNLQSFVTSLQLSPLCHTTAQKNQHSMENPFVFIGSP